MFSLTQSRCSMRRSWIKELMNTEKSVRYFLLVI